MLFARMLSPVTTLGPGRRVTIWTQGCSKNCKGCISPEMQSFDEKKNVPAELLANLIIDESACNNCYGLTISGGDPLEQPEELEKLLSIVRDSFEDILVYTGYRIEEIERDDIKKECLKYIDVLVDGRYEESLNSGKTVLTGSDNQRVIFLNPLMEEKYKSYMEGKRSVEPFMVDGKLILVGILKGE